MYSCLSSRRTANPGACAVRLCCCLYGTLCLALSTFCYADTHPAGVESAIYKVMLRNDQTVKAGTGTLIAPNMILTSCHILKGSAGWPSVIHRKTGREYSVANYVALGDFDACVLMGSFDGQPLSFSKQFWEQETVWLYGYLQHIPSVGQGVILGLVEDARMGLLIKSSAFCWPGTSGGALIDQQGSIVGMTFGFRNDDPNKCIAIPAAALMPYLNALH